MQEKLKTIREVSVYFIMAALLLFGTVGLVFSDDTPVPADSASQAANIGSGAADAARGGGAATGVQSTSTQADSAQGGLTGMLLPMGVMFLVFFFLVIRPQQKKTKEHEGMIKELKRGDDIVTNSGILGKVTGLSDKVVTLEIASNVRVKMLKSQVSRVITGSDLSNPS